MIDSFIDWLENEILESIKTAFIIVILIAFSILTLPLWIFPFIVWYFFVWKKEDTEVSKHTNADRIRSMSDEELAKENIYFVSALNEKEGLNYTGFDGHYYRTAEEVVEANMKWLQLEVEV